MSYRCLVSLALMFLGMACAKPRYPFTVEIVNNSLTQISVGLTKAGPQGSRPAPEEGWTSPEDIAIHAPALADRHWGTLLKPGERTVIGPQEGLFHQGFYAVLRVYGGDQKVEDLLAFKPTDPDRVDVPLWPGLNRLAVEKDGRRLSVRQIAPPTNNSGQ